MEDGMKMPKKKPTKRKLLSFAREEKATARLYDQLGFRTQAHQEMQHAKFFEKKSKEEIDKIYASV